MSETTEDGLTEEMLLEGFEHWATNEEAQRTKRVTPKGVLKLVALAREGLQSRAQLTEVTQERDANVTHNRKLQQQLEHRTLTLGAEVKKREAAEAALAPLRAVVEAARNVSSASWDGITARAASARMGKLHDALNALDALPADPSAPTPR